MLILQLNNNNLMKKFWFYLCIVMLVSWLPASAQQPTVRPTPPDDEPLRVSTEEVQLSVTAQNDFGHFDPTLVKDDLLIVENGVPQTIASLERASANVLFLLDTGLELNYAKNTFQTGITAELVLRNLQSKDYFSIVQCNDKVEVIAEWTNNADEAAKALSEKLFGGKRSRLVLGLNASLESFKSRSMANRHLILITDGIESVTSTAEQQKAFQALLAANITVHIISYTRLEEQKAQKAIRPLKLGDGKTKPRISEEMMEQIIYVIPDNPRKLKLRRFMRTANEAQKLIILGIDGEWLKRVNRQRGAWREAEVRLTTLAEETGGIFEAPEDIESMLLRGREIAQAIDSQYIVTYTPKRSISETANNDTRQVRVVSRRVGLKVRSKQKVVFSATKERSL